MSWDVMVFNFHGSPPSDLSELPDDYKPTPLGPAAMVRQAIATALPAVDWTDPSWGLYTGDGFSFEFNTGKEDPVDTIMVHIRGGGDPIACLLKIAVPNNWTLFDCSSSRFIDLESPSSESWVRFQAYRDKVVNHYREPGGA